MSVADTLLNTGLIGFRNTGGTADANRSGPIGRTRGAVDWSPDADGRTAAVPGAISLP